MSIIENGLHLIVSAVTQSYDFGYDLWVIPDDDPVPLAGGPVVNYYPIAIIAVALLALITVVAVWLFKRSGYKNRLLELRAKTGDTDKPVPLTIRRIKDAVREAERNLVTI